MNPVSAISAHDPDGASLPKSSLIICSRNREEMLRAAVASVLGGTDLPTEIVIVDQSDVPSEALSSLTAKHCDIRYVWSESVGLSRAMNIAVAKARYELLAFTHDDVTVTPQWFRNLLGALVSSGSRTVVTGLVAPTAPETVGGFQTALKLDAARTEYAGRVDHDVLYPLNMAMSRQAFDEVGPFDERLGPGTPFPGAEDSDFGYRLLSAGYRIVYTPDAALFHRAWRPRPAYIPLRWAYGVGRGGFYAKYVAQGDLHMFRRLCRDILAHLWSLVRITRHGRRHACGDAALACGVLFGAVRWLITVPSRSRPRATTPG